MFERFTVAARGIVLRAHEEAQTLGYAWIGTEHLLLALAADSDAAGQALSRHGADTDTLRAALVRTTPPATALDADALSGLGIDLDKVRQRVEDTFGPGALDAPPPGRHGWFARRGPLSRHLPFTPGAKRALERALREAQHLGQGRLGTGVLLLGVLDADDAGVALLTSVGAEPAAIRAAVVTSLRRTA